MHRLSRVGAALAVTAVAGLAGAVPAQAEELMQVGLVMDRVGKVGSGYLTLTGRAFCSEEEALDLFVTVTQNPDRRVHWEQTVYCEDDTPFTATSGAPGFAPGQAFLDAELCTNNGLGYEEEDCVFVSRIIDIQSK